MIALPFLRSCIPQRLSLRVYSRRDMAGYSGTPLPKKLGIAEAHRVALLGAPERFEDTLGALPIGATTTRSLAGGAPFDVIVLFVTKRADLAAKMPKAKARMTPACGLWVAWPKKASGVATDLTEDVVRVIALELGLVDNKVCAIDEVWSGLRCVIRLADRPKSPARRR